MTTLTEFLLARIAEDEAVARVAKHLASGRWKVLEVAPWGSVVEGSSPMGNPRADTGDPELWDHEGALGMFDEVATHVARHDPARVLAECEAKRRVVEKCREWTDKPASWREDVELSDGYDIVDTVLAAIALPYADHPDYREEWKP